jgi:hypothetical protein
MSHPSFRRFSVALSSALVIASAAPLQAQSTRPQPVVGTRSAAKPITSTLRRSEIQRSQSTGLPDPSQPFYGSLVVSVDGVHWGSSATLVYKNPCAPQPPAGCGVRPPQMPLYLHWNANLPLEQMHVVGAGDGKEAYFLVDSPTNDPNCWNPTIDGFAWGSKTTDHWYYPTVITPNSATMFTCTYRVQGRLVPNPVSTNSVTVVVNIVH